MNDKLEEKSEQLINTQLEMVLANQKVAASITIRTAASANYIITNEVSYLDKFKECSEI